VSVDIKRVGVVGCGTMGSGICEVSARAGFDVTFSEIDEHAVAAGNERISRSLERAVERGKLERADADSILGRISSTVALEDLTGCDIVFEAVPEHLDLKKDVFARLDAVLPGEAMLATNTSSLPVIDMAVATKRTDRVIGFH
jgi:3-hydroxybutyryl-CoA dehydrogenase